MSHPYESIKSHNVQKSRVSKITHGAASATPKIHRKDGGRIPMTEAKMAAKIEGEATPRRADRVARKKGGRVGKGASVNINVISAPSAPGGGGAGPMAGPPPMPPGPPPMPPGAGPMPPRPPMGPGGPGMAGSGPSGIPGMMPRADGGRAYAKGGAVKSGPTWAEGRENGTPVEHDPGKNQKLLKPASAKRASGGKVGKLNAPQGVAPATDLPGGAGGGLGRLAKARKYGG